jgi:O-methyltransferase
MSPNKKVWLADTFQGVVNQSKMDLSYNGGEHSDTSKEIVLSLMHKLRLENFETCKGVFPDETGHLIPKVLSFVHIDVDVYESAKAIWFFVENRVSIGGVVVFDDYGFSSTSGVTLFVNEIRANPKYRFVYNLNGHAIFIRIY